ncbi:MAG TPA: hypothetical protein VN047_10920, partial [Sphingopyxis sp.]|uniref:hypothetical protein n=1 Tax=Sphingopyxis sp. TaxID=1908224 RepID=UPI002CF9B576
MIDRDPVEARLEINLKLAHQVARVAAQVAKLGRILRTDNETEVVTIAAAALSEGSAIGLIAGGIEHRGVASVAGYTVAFEIGYVTSEWGGTKPRAAMPDYPRHHSDTAHRRTAPDDCKRPATAP